MKIRPKTEHQADSALPTVTVLPPLRCGEQVGSSLHDVCGARATWVRIAPGAAPLGFRCDAHKRADDRKAVDDFNLLRIAIKLDVIFAGTSFVPGLAHTEAFERLCRAVEGVGGLVNLHEIRSYVGRYAPAQAPPVAPSRGKRTRGW